MTKGQRREIELAMVNLPVLLRDLLSKLPGGLRWRLNERFTVRTIRQEQEWTAQTVLKIRDRVKKKTIQRTPSFISPDEFLFEALDYGSRVRLLRFVLRYFCCADQEKLLWNTEEHDLRKRCARLGYLPVDRESFEEYFQLTWQKHIEEGFLRAATDYAPALALALKTMHDDTKRTFCLSVLSALTGTYAAVLPAFMMCSIQSDGCGFVRQMLGDAHMTCHELDRPSGHKLELLPTGATLDQAKFFADPTATRQLFATLRDDLKQCFWKHVESALPDWQDIVRLGRALLVLYPNKTG